MKKTFLTACTISTTICSAFAQSPSDILDFTNWSLNDPFSGANHISSESLENGYSTEYFNTSGNYVRFSVPLNGKTTDNSDQVRTELREQPGNSNNNQADSNGTWKPEDGSYHRLVGRFRVLDASNGGLMIAQIHTKNSGERPMMKLIWREKSGDSNDTLTIEHMSTNSSSSGYAKVLLENLDRSTVYTYLIKIKDVDNERVCETELRIGRTTIAKVTAPFGETVPGTSAKLSSEWLNDDCYFKCGGYNKDSGSSSTPGGNTSIIEYRSIKLKHK